MWGNVTRSRVVNFHAYAMNELSLCGECHSVAGRKLSRMRNERVIVMWGNVTRSRVVNFRAYAMNELSLCGGMSIGRWS